MCLRWYSWADFMSYRSHNSCCFNDLQAAFQDSHRFHPRHDFSEDYLVPSQELDPMVFISYDEILKESIVSPQSEF